jgi:hypothetical protein
MERQSVTPGRLLVVPEQRQAGRRSVDLGDDAGASVLVNAETLASMLRGLVPSQADVAPGDGWWTLRCFGGRISVQGDDFDQLAGRAVTALRRYVNEADPDRRSTSPVVWLVRLSSDRDLRRWLNIPTS